MIGSRCFLSKPTKIFSLQNLEKTEWKIIFFLIYKNDHVDILQVAFIYLFIYFSFPLDSTWPFSFFFFSFFLLLLPDSCLFSFFFFLFLFSLGRTVALFFFLGCRLFFFFHSFYFLGPGLPLSFCFSFFFPCNNIASSFVFRILFLFF